MYMAMLGFFRFAFLHYLRVCVKRLNAVIKIQGFADSTNNLILAQKL